MLATYQYRVLKSSWGIAIDITAEAIPLSSFSGITLEITTALRLIVEKDAGVSSKDLGYLIKGLKLVADEISRTRKTDEPLVIRIVNLCYSLCDYQEEGAACAIANWAALLFGFSAPEIPVFFNKEKNRYIFDFEKSANK
jgi:hypothetical protein